VGAFALSGCAGLSSNNKLATKAPEPATPGAGYALQADSDVKSINLRVEPTGLSLNQRRALDQVAAKASWTSGEPVDVEIVTSDDPTALAAGQGVGSYLAAHDVANENLIQKSTQEQPADVITVNLVSFTAHTYECGKEWENLSATGSNKAYKNFGCAIASNLAAQVADPRDLDHAAAATPIEAARKSVVLEHYRKGEVTSTQSSDDAKGTISDAIK
jgi:pilus assembly protein CpaD